jgi:TatD DNase family protein
VDFCSPFPKKTVAVGEIGLDYYWDKTYGESQQEFFLKQIEISKAASKPIIVHSRDATLDTFSILKSHPMPGVLHCYSQSREMAKEYTKLGYYLGVGGVVTFKNSREIKEVVKTIDLSRLVSETDGPYLAPSPYRGKRNEPSFLPYILEEIALLKNIDIKTVKNTLEANTEKLFGI